MNLDAKRDVLEFHFSNACNEFWREIGHIVADGFEANGFHVVRHETEKPVLIHSRAIHVAVGGQEYFNTFIKDEDRIRETASKMVALTGEQPCSRWFAANTHRLSYCQECWDITNSGTAALQSHGIKARHLQLGFSKRLQNDNFKLEKKQLDIFFLASLTKDRAPRVAQFGIDRWYLENHFQLVELGYAKTSKDKIYLSNSDRNNLASQSKIVLNYHGHLIPFFEWHRALVAMANKSLFITDPVCKSNPLVEGKHFISASPRVINHVVDFFLENSDMRQEITNCVFQFLTAHLRMEQCTDRFARGDVFEDFSPAGEEKSTLAIQNDLKRYLAKKRCYSFPMNFAASCAQKKSVPAKHNSKNDVIHKRNEISKRLAAEILDFKDGLPYDIERFSSHSNSSIPQVSVVVSLFNYESTICTALDSLLFAVADKDTLEVVVVDDGSTDESLEAARQWLAKSPFRGVLIKKQHNTGFISSRNIGIRESSGEYIATLDADNAFLPSGIDRLLEKIMNNDADACYGIIICIDETGKPSGLLSAQSWDIGRLLYSPYIDAMALFKKSTLVKLGCYDTEMFKHGWFGWEDYDLWLRLAESDARVEFFPNFVALYRSHSSSMINATNLFASEITDYLFKKYKNFIIDNSTHDTLFGFPKRNFSL
jgi:glycosyltransferase involved in cell wall biosynthesis